MRGNRKAFINHKTRACVVHQRQQDMAKELKIGILQQHNVADRGDNMRRLADGVTSLAQRGAELIVLQELHNSLYFCQVESVDNFDLAEPVPGPSTDFYGQLAKQLNVVLVTSLFERRAPGQDAHSR